MKIHEFEKYDLNSCSSSSNFEDENVDDVSLSSSGDSSLDGRSGAEIVDHVLIFQKPKSTHS